MNWDRMMWERLLLTPVQARSNMSFRAKAEYDSRGNMVNVIPLEIWQRYVDTTSFTKAESTELLP